MAGNLLPTAWAGKSPTCSVGGKSPAWAGKSALAGNMPDFAQICRGRFTNSAPADVIAALAGSECYQLRTASVQLPIWQRSGQISVEALAPRARLWELVLNDLNDGFVEVPRALWAGIWAGNMPRQELRRMLLRQEFLPGNVPR
ncbi:hypothetical protein V6N13_065886 [Hibiscus sabdariffa]